MSEHVPVLVIAFNRPELLLRVLSNLAMAYGAAEHDYFVYIDGARNEGEQVLCDKVADVVDQFRDIFPRLFVTRRECNLGCRRNVVEAISEVIEQRQSVIVVEDDILVSKTFLDYMDAALKMYESDSRIWSVNAWRSRFVHIPKAYAKDVYLTPRMMCWGWGTWKSRWEGVDFELSDWPDSQTDVKLMNKLDVAGIDLRRMIQLQYEGVLKTWDVQCCYHMVKNGLYSIEPCRPLTKNIGSGDASTHCVEEDAIITRAAYYNFTPRLEVGLVPNEQLMRQFPNAFFNPSLTTRLYRKVLRLLLKSYPRNDSPKEMSKSPRHGERK